jgi:hypothetical protein
VLSRSDPVANGVDTSLLEHVGPIEGLPDEKVLMGYLDRNVSIDAS